MVVKLGEFNGKGEAQAEQGDADGGKGAENQAPSPIHGQSPQAITAVFEPKGGQGKPAGTPEQAGRQGERKEQSLSPRFALGGGGSHGGSKIRGDGRCSQAQTTDWKILPWWSLRGVGPASQRRSPSE